MKDGDVIRAGAIEVKVLHTPGHTPGSVCYLAGKHLFSGDTLLAGGVGSTNSVEELLQTYKSVTEKLYVLPDNVFLLPGHGKGSVLGVEKKGYQVFDPVLHHQRDVHDIQVPSDHLGLLKEDS